MAFSRGKKKLAALLFFFQYVERAENAPKMGKLVPVPLAASNNMRKSSRKQLNFRKDTGQVSRDKSGSLPLPRAHCRGLAEAPIPSLSESCPLSLSSGGRHPRAGRSVSEGKASGLNRPHGAPQEQAGASWLARPSSASHWMPPPDQSAPRFPASHMAPDHRSIFVLNVFSLLYPLHLFSFAV